MIITCCFYYTRPSIGKLTGLALTPSGSQLCILHNFLFKSELYINFDFDFAIFTLPVFPSLSFVSHLTAQHNLKASLNSVIVTIRNKPYKQMKTFWASELLVRCSRKPWEEKLTRHQNNKSCSHWNCSMFQRPIDGIKSLSGHDSSMNKQSLRRRSINNWKNRRRPSKSKLLMSCQGISTSQQMINQQTPYSQQDINFS